MAQAPGRPDRRHHPRSPGGVDGTGGRPCGPPRRTGRHANPARDTASQARAAIVLRYYERFTDAEIAEVLAFLRQRHGLPNCDLDRIVRMQAFLRAWTHAAVTDGWLLGARADRLASIVTEHVRIEPTLDVLELARRVVSLDEADLRIATIPITGTGTTVSGGNGITVDPAKVRAFTREFLDGAEEPSTHAPHTTLPPDPAPCVD